MENEINVCKKQWNKDKIIKKGNILDKRKYYMSPLLSYFGHETAIVELLYALETIKTI